MCTWSCVQGQLAGFLHLLRMKWACLFLWYALRTVPPHLYSLHFSRTCSVCCMKPRWGRASCLFLLMGFSYLLILVYLFPVYSPTTQRLLQLLSEGRCGWRPCLGGRLCLCRPGDAEVPGHLWSTAVHNSRSGSNETPVEVIVSVCTSWP